MKQNITKKQWDKLGAAKKDIILDKFNDSEDNKVYEYNRGAYLLLSIGQMIEFLGKDLLEIYIQKDGFKYGWWVESRWSSFYRKGLADALWEAVKYKLNK